MSATTIVVSVAALLFAATVFLLRGRLIGERLLYGLGFGAAALSVASLLTGVATNSGDFLVAAALSLGFASVAEAIRKNRL